MYVVFGIVLLLVLAVIFSPGKWHLGKLRSIGMTNTEFGQFTLGRVVKQKNPLPLMGRVTGTYKSCFKGMYGHITGFDVVEWDEGFDTILLVKWCDGAEYAIHPNAVELL